MLSSKNKLQKSSMGLKNVNNKKRKVGRDFEDRHTPPSAMRKIWVLHCQKETDLLVLMLYLCLLTRRLSIPLFQLCEVTSSSFATCFSSFSCLPPSPVLCGAVYSCPFTTHPCKDEGGTLLLTQGLVTDNCN